MENDQVDKEIARRSTQIYLPLSVSVAFTFFLVASLLGDYPPVARFGGAVWVGLLTLIVSMPVVTSRVKMRRKAGG